MPGDDVAGDVGGFQMLLTKALKQQQGHLPLATAFTAANGRIVGDNLGLKIMAKEGRNHGFYHPTHPTFKKCLSLTIRQFSRKRVFHCLPNPLSGQVYVCWGDGKSCDTDKVRCTVVDGCGM